MNQPIARTQLETLAASLEAATQEANMAGAALNEAIAVRNNALNDAETSREQLRLANDEIARITALSVDAISLAAALDDAQQTPSQQPAALAPPAP